jgi:hypothetical protein
MTRKFVIDSNALRSADLERFLSESDRNMAVLTDYVAMEAYKARRIETLVESFSIVSRFPRQVIVLRSSAVIARMSARPAGLERRLVDQAQTRGFGRYVKQLEKAAAGNATLQQELRKMGDEASDHMELLLRNVPDMKRSFLELSTEFSEAEIAAIRNQASYPVTLVQRLMRLVGDMLALMIDAQPTLKVPPNITIRNLFLCRVALCFALLIGHWIYEGRQMGTRNDRVRNDHVDMFIAAYSTYFDGVLSSDQKLTTIAAQARYIMDL